MSIRRVTIGRAPQSDIRLGDGHVYASNRHGEIYSDGTQMVYRDTSTNGTLVNRTMVRRRTVPLRRGDLIMIAGRYLLDWNAIDGFLPAEWTMGNTVFRHNVNITPMTERSEAFHTTGDNFIHIDVNAWNWGATGLYPFWGLFCGCWWALPVGIAAWWLFPLPNLLFGYYGTRWALRTHQWPSLNDFNRVQRQWRLAGIVATVLLSLVFIWWLGANINYLLK